MSLATAGIHCTISQRLLGAMEDCFIVRVQQPWTLCHLRRCMSASRWMFGSLCNVAAAHSHKHRRQGDLALTDRVPRCQNYKWRLNPVWHRMLYSCTQWASKD